MSVEAAVSTPRWRERHASTIRQWRLYVHLIGRSFSSMLGLFLVILLFAPGIGSQYLLWPVALGSLYGGRRFFLYSAAATLWILGGYLAWPGSGRWMGQLTWLTVILWTIGFFREELATRREAVPA